VLLLPSLPPPGLRVLVGALAGAKKGFEMETKHTKWYWCVGGNGYEVHASERGDMPIADIPTDCIFDTDKEKEEIVEFIAAAPETAAERDRLKGIALELRRACIESLHTLRDSMELDDDGKDADGFEYMAYFWLTQALAKADAYFENERS